MHRFELTGSGIVIATSLLLAIVPAPVAFAAPPEPSMFTTPVTEIDAVGDPSESPLAAKTLQSDTVWIADWSFDTPGGGCTSAGWVVYDFRVKDFVSNYWVVDNRFNGLGGVISGKSAILGKHDL